MCILLVTSKADANDTTVAVIKLSAWQAWMLASCRHTKAHTPQVRICLLIGFVRGCRDFITDA